MITVDGEEKIDPKTLEEEEAEEESLGPKR